MISDVSNDLMIDETWDPFALCSDYVKKIPAPKSLLSDVPFEQAKDLSVNLDEPNQCKSDIFIDNLISIGVDIGDNLQRLIAAPCTVMHAIAHKVSGPVHLPRNDIIADDKNDAEGAPEESKIC